MPNPLRADPTRTTMLRRQFGDDLSRRFTRLDRAIRALIVTEDAFGLEQGSAEGALATNTRWAFQTNPQKLASFKRWLSEQVDSGIISVDVARYLNSAYRLGLGRSFTDSRIKDLLEQPISFLLSSRDRFVQNAMNELVTVSKLEVLYTRAFDQLEGITKQMSGQLSRILADGLVDGSSARTLARRISEQIGISKKRALLIARTECLPGDTQVSSAMVRAVFRRWYSGPMVQIKTSSGREISTTPNHPMLTEQGWVSSGMLQKGDYLICDSGKENFGFSGDPNVDTSPSTLSEIFDSLSAVVACERKITSKPDFHGDGMEGHVDILRPNGVLGIGRFSPLDKPLCNQILSPSGLSGSGFCHFCSRLLDVDQRPCLCNSADLDSHFFEFPYNRHVMDTKGISNRLGGFPTDISFTDIIREGNCLVGNSALLPSLDLSRGVGSCYSSSSNNITNCSLMDSELGSNFGRPHPTQIELDHIVSLRVRKFCGHVYNLETPFGYYNIVGAYTGNTIHAHAEGQLDAFERLGIDEVGILLEWIVGENPCPVCRKQREKRFFKVSESHGLIPMHPNCQCAFVPIDRKSTPLRRSRRERLTLR